MSKIEWTDETWNPVRGCAKVSEGCRNCYAMRQAHRMSGPGGAYEGLTKATPNGPEWTGEVRLVPELLDRPLRWRKARRVFVCSMSDLFHPQVPDYFIGHVFRAMARAPEHTFQVLTKRPERMAALLGSAHFWIHVGRAGPLPSVWCGTSIEDQAAANVRIPHLLNTPAALRFLSCEPLLGPVDIRRHLHGIHWVIIGGESGPRARPCDVAWIRSLIEQCREADVAVFCKQLGAYSVGAPRPSGGSYHRKGGDPDEWPADLRVREFPDD